VRILDLFCGAGGAAMGYHRAFPDAEIIGVDIAAQPRYPFRFVQADAMTYPLDGFDFIHASPPCKAHTLTGWAFHFGYHANHLDLLTPTRVRLIAADVPYVIENVPGSPMTPNFILCGSEFRLGVRRHRWFETNPAVFEMRPPCVHSLRVVSPHGHPNAAKGSAKEWAVAMDIDWMSTDELAQAIPPAYTEHIGHALAVALERAA